MKYTAEIRGHSWARGPQNEFNTIREAREWAESYGTTADACSIHVHKGKLVAEYRRDPNGDGTRWFKAVIA
jgi:hypothetical protein